jgi:hypothetical protein
MKKSLVLIFLLTIAIAHLKSQVTSVNYFMEFNYVDSTYDCFLIINAGQATNVPDRIQYNSNLTIVAPSNAPISIAENFNPLTTSGTPIQWVPTGSYNYSGSKYLSVIPTISPAGIYGYLYPGDTIKLFSIETTYYPLGCVNQLRFFENGVDPNPSGADLSNGFTIGSPEQLYSGNSSVVNITRIDSLTSNCNNFIEIISHTNNGFQIPLLYNWTGPDGFTSNSANAIIQNPTSANIGLYTLTIQDSMGCIVSSQIYGNLKPKAGPDIVQCGNEPTVLQGLLPSNGIWKAGPNNPNAFNPLINSANGLASVKGTYINSAATGKFIYTHLGCADTMVLTYHPRPMIIAPQEIICLNDTTVSDLGLSYNHIGTWSSLNNNVATTTGSGQITLIDIGDVGFIFTINDTGCADTSSITEVISPPTILINGPTQIFLGGQTSVTTSLPIDSISSSDPLIASVSSNGVVSGKRPGKVVITVTNGICLASSDSIEVITNPNPITCSIGNLILNSQIEINTFPTSFPGCNIVEGNLTVSNFTDLEPLIQLTEIKGNLIVISNDVVSNAFSNLSRVSKSLLIESAVQINATNSQFNVASISNSFTSLKYLGKDLKIKNTISNYNNFENLDTIGRDFIIDLDALSSLPYQLNDLKFIGRNINTINCEIELNSITNIYGNLNLEKSSSKLNQLKLVKGNFSLADSKFENFNFVDSIFGDLKIEGSYNLSGQYSNSNISGFQNLKFLSGKLFISNNSQLLEISGLNNLNKVEGGIEIKSNKFLQNINGLDHSIATPLITVIDNPLLNDCGVAAICEKVWKTNGLIVSSNDEDCSTIAKVRTLCPQPSDTDEDTVLDVNDNCLNIANSNQNDSNENGIGDVCDNLQNDTDTDGTIDVSDNCPIVFNPNQADANNDGQGDICDTDSDKDGDGKKDNIDNCASIFNPDQRDCNANSIGDVCEAFIDADCDAIADNADNCPSIFNPNQIDYNNNTIGDACETFSKVGLNNLNPKAELHLSYGNLYIDHPDKGIIIRDKNNFCYKTIVDIVNGNPQLKLVVVACPQ